MCCYEKPHTPYVSDEDFDFLLFTRQTLNLNGFGLLTQHMSPGFDYDYWWTKKLLFERESERDYQYDISSRGYSW